MLGYAAKLVHRQLDLHKDWVWDWLAKVMAGVSQYGEIRGDCILPSSACFPMPAPLPKREPDRMETICEVFGRHSWSVP